MAGTPEEVTTEEVPTVIMFDLMTGLVHRCGDVHLQTACGVAMEVCTVGPPTLLEQHTHAWCPLCFDRRGHGG